MFLIFDTLRLRSRRGFSTTTTTTTSTAVWRSLSCLQIEQRFSFLQIYLSRDKRLIFFLWRMKYFLILTSLAFQSSLADIGVPLTSSCHLFPGGNGPWKKGSRGPIKSWIQSLIVADSPGPGHNLVLISSISFYGGNTYKSLTIELVW